MSEQESQIEILANFIMASCPFEIEPEDGAGDVAIRLLGRFASGMHQALLELGEPTADYPAPFANAVKILREALGDWPRSE